MLLDIRMSSAISFTGALDFVSLARVELRPLTLTRNRAPIILPNQALFSNHWRSSDRPHQRKVKVVTTQPQRTGYLSPVHSDETPI
jgi:hypothetical protein